MADKKIGRNDPCWCGSGKKYKQCHEITDKKIFRYALEGHTEDQGVCEDQCGMLRCHR